MKQNQIILIGLIIVLAIGCFIAAKTPKRKQEKQCLGQGQNNGLMTLAKQQQAKEDLKNIEIEKAQSLVNLRQVNPEILDRQPLAEEPSVRLSANDIYHSNAKSWLADDKELYATDEPLFPQNGPINLLPPDINSTHRRVNFY